VRCSIGCGKDGPSETCEVYAEHSEWAAAPAAGRGESRTFNCVFYVRSTFFAKTAAPESAARCSTSRTGTLPLLARTPAVHRSTAARVKRAHSGFRILPDGHFGNRHRVIHCAGETRIVGIGASAGGRRPLSTLAPVRRAWLGLHRSATLDPTHKARWRRLLQRVATIPVRYADHGTPICPTLRMLSRQTRTHVTGCVLSRNNPLPALSALADMVLFSLPVAGPR